MIPFASEQLSSTGTNVATSSPTNVTGATVTLAGNRAHGILVTASITTARVTFDGSTPGGTTGHVIPLNQVPVFLPVGPGANVKMLSIAGNTAATGAATLDITWLQ